MGVVEVDSVVGRRPADLERLEVLMVVEKGVESVEGGRRICVTIDETADDKDAL